jgi:N-acetylmuramoyl-L-alanine amidase
MAASTTASNPYLAGMRIAANRPGVTRLVTDLKSVMNPLVSLYRATGDFGPRLVIDLVPGAPVASAAASPVQPAQSAATVAVASAAPTPPPQAVVASRIAEPLPAAPEASEPVRQAGPASPAQQPEADKPLRSAKALAIPVSLEKQVEQAIEQSGKAEASGKPGKSGSPAETGYNRLVTVAIDPGHGGVDPGAIGANGTYEKHITLAVAQRLKTHIDKQPGMRAVLTRDSDVFIPLHERVNKARRNQADLFVSIHADAFMKASAKGSSVFALSEKGASSAAARWLAKRENDADLVGGLNIDVKDVYLKQTLIDLTQTATIADSLRLGKAVLEQIGEINSLHKPRVEQAGFAVLKAPDIPSILVETAFISNPDEEARLNDEAYQERMAAAIVSGIKAYFEHHPPAGHSRVAQNF